MGAAALAHDAAAGQSHPRIENCVWQVSILTPYDTGTGTRHNRARGVRSYGDAMVPLTPARYQFEYLKWWYASNEGVRFFLTGGLRGVHFDDDDDDDD